MSTIHTYWSQIFVLPIGVMDRIQALCRNFLWEGSDKYSKAPLVSWNVLCNSKDHGGLGLIDSKQWNVVAIGKLVWWLETKQDHLWIRWVDNIYLKGKDWMVYEPTAYSSWSWRKICEVNNVFKPGFIQGNGCGDGHYTIVAGYNWLRQENMMKVQWHKVVWNRFNNSKWCFTMWLKQHQRLLTLDRLAKMGMEVPTVCFLCDWLHVNEGDIADCDKLLKIHGQTILIRQIIMAAVVGIVYGIWLNRNICRIEGYVMQPRTLIQLVKEDCRRRILGTFQGEMKMNDRLWCSVMGLK
ncbi:uncharacterized protein LOC141608506 [Silene latifolia]|uniref:uncharacterized protein LOC141608506 n=1 Tax=Silene latifolia TaxID=37657 RepID=UPI003D779FC8